jgi:hypothetical protein
MKRKSKRPSVLSSRPEGLEPRSLLAAGVSAGLNLVMELGEVSKAAALKGVEVAAPITADGSITFDFGVKAAGNYLLKVRHVGAGLTLQATGPSGSASVNPGPAGPFETIALPLKAADYQIKASATDGQPVFVDWELLLTPGVGQSAAIGSTLAAPSASVPLPGTSAASPTSPSPSTSPTNWGPAVSSAMVGAGGPIGRSDPGRPISPVGPASPHGAVALADAGDGLAPGALNALAPIAEEAETPASSGATPLLALEMGDAGQDLVALGEVSWLDHLAELQARLTTGPIAEAVGGSALAANTIAIGDPLDEEVEPSVVTKAASPGLIVMGLVVASAARRMGVDRGLLPSRRKSAPMPSAFPPSRREWS